MSWEERGPQSCERRTDARREDERTSPHRVKLPSLTRAWEEPRTNGCCCQSLSPSLSLSLCATTSPSDARIFRPGSEHLASSSPQLYAQSDKHRHKLYLLACPWISGPTRSPGSARTEPAVNPPPCVREPKLSSSPGFNTADQWTEPPQRPAALQTRRKQWVDTHTHTHTDTHTHKHTHTHTTHTHTHTKHTHTHTHHYQVHTNSN